MAFQFYSLCYDTVARLLVDIENGSTHDASELVALAADLSRALGTLMMEYERVTDFQKQHGDVTHGRSLDLAEARAEIEKRLARFAAHDIEKSSA